MVALRTQAGMDQFEIMDFYRTIADLMDSGLCIAVFLSAVSSTPLWYIIQVITLGIIEKAFGRSRTTEAGARWVADSIVLNAYATTTADIKYAQPLNV
ncbi:uncharacterized protein PGRI_050190 [Penicillium griseofulvum]|uniref:Uncharacterized protein n=1 Tax=Penicillium patulum TaxID=5078 RepID=A0A135LAZ5_PENPA|nr:uncharacterized protein PGRI_050190 [Penicillium griseofulvum]KXG46163.1 hypothetical protein PGRI_050190 [Penicillium griseofulvum]